jgi:hypothetical protein
MSKRKTETVESLTEKARVIRDKIDRIESAERIELANKVVGKCFRYRNCYSCPQSDADYWWLYRRVTMVDSHGWLRVFDFQKDKDGKIWIEPESRAMSPQSLGEPITLKQFQHAWKTLANTINWQARNAKAVS